MRVKPRKTPEPVAHTFLLFTRKRLKATDRAGLLASRVRIVRSESNSPRPSRNSFQWPIAVSSLTVARQRGILTRFPVFTERQRRASRMTSQDQRAGRSIRAESTVRRQPSPTMLTAAKRRSQIRIVSTEDVSTKRIIRTKEQSLVILRVLRGPWFCVTLASPPNTKQSTTPHSTTQKSPTENKPKCASLDKECPPAIAPKEYSSGQAQQALSPAPTSNPTQATISNLPRST